MSEHRPTELVQTRDRIAIAAMFNRISHSYDRMNRIMTFGQDGRWRRLAADAARLSPGDRALDVAAGTGDMARELAKRVSPGGEVIGVDISAGMLAVAREKTAGLAIQYEQLDILESRFASEFEAATVSFGFRNFSDREAAVRAMWAALKPQGRIVVLELTPTRGLLQPVVQFYEHRLIPLVGGLVSREGTAYRYLPASVAVSPTADQIESLLKKIGMSSVYSRQLNFGTVAIVVGTK